MHAAATSFDTFADINNAMKSTVTQKHLTLQQPLPHIRVSKSSIRLDYLWLFSPGVPHTIVSALSTLANCLE